MSGFWNGTTEAIVTIAVAITGVAILAVLVSKKSNTANVIQSAGSAFSNALAVAVSPVTGAVPQPNLAYPNSGLGTLGATDLNFGGFAFH